MRWRELARDDAGRSIVLVFDRGDTVMATLTNWCASQQIRAAQFTAIGAFAEVTVAWFDWEAKEYRKIPIREQVEVISLIGDVAQSDGEPAVHAHVVVGRSDGTTRGGHFVDGTVRPTLELVLHETPAHLSKRYDPASGLALIAPQEQ